MYRKLTSCGKGKALTALAAMLLAGTTMSALAEDSAEDPALNGWLGKEITIDSSSFDDHIPVGGKLTLTLDHEDKVVRLCARSVAKQRTPWRMDFAIPCGVSLNFTLGTRYCSVEDVKAGNAEVLSACHRLRSHDVAMHPAATAKGAVELNDMIIFLVQNPDGTRAIAVLVDSPSRVTTGGIATGQVSIP